MHVAQIMTSPAVTAGRLERFKDAVHRMLVAGIGGMPVVDDENHLVGMVDEGDLAAKEAHGIRGPRSADAAAVADVFSGEPWRWEEEAGAVRVGEVMTPVPLTFVGPEDDVRVVARLLVGVKRLPVVDGNGEVVGVVARVDLPAFARPL